MLGRYITIRSRNVGGVGVLREVNVYKKACNLAVNITKKTHTKTRQLITPYPNRYFITGLVVDCFFG